MDSKKPHYRVSLSEQALNHEKLMRAIVKNLADTPMVLKGGTALYLGYGLNRFSEDLDFDCYKKINLLGRVKSTIPNGIILNDIHIKKDTDSVGRYMVRYATKDNKEEQTLKLEISYRDAPKESEVNVIEGMRIAKIERIIDNKTKARDLFDLHFLAKHYEEHFNLDLASRLKDFSKDHDKLVSDYLVDVKLDALLNQIMDLEETALELGVMAQLIHKKLEKQSHSLNALQEQQGYSNNDNSLDNSNENTYTPKRRR
ncbi:nucleotidyl transferase AbiEii/AbiGii toxin family protein [Helicobacter pylori]|uniref:nucleotidyl transferase AbiEii/AbiGii toxin family protein n=1 Tax=Helicobacter pylori TaxID=210 RepID=UPI001ABA57E7|nr:nucleotidyl transferase AbiEii/AbiGii toxin family protein [Helicobacter pylori]